jgi:hypothetical protein
MFKPCTDNTHFPPNPAPHTNSHTHSHTPSHTPWHTTHNTTRNTQHDRAHGQRQVVGALLDCEAPDDFVNNLILSVRSLLPVDALVEQVEKRNRCVRVRACVCVRARVCACVCVRVCACVCCMATRDARGCVRAPR